MKFAFEIAIELAITTNSIWNSIKTNKANRNWNNDYNEFIIYDRQQIYDYVWQRIYDCVWLCGNFCYVWKKFLIIMNHCLFIQKTICI